MQNLIRLATALAALGLAACTTTNTNQGITLPKPPTVQY